MTIAFDRPLGAPADVKELEYISALHQTEKKSLRINGSINAVDIQTYLSSRHGLNVDLEMIQTEILDNLCGDFEGETDDVMDLCQVVAILLIPHLLGKDVDGKSEDVADLMEQIMSVIMNDVDSMSNLSNDQSGSMNIGDTDNPPILNRSLLRSILECYGEFDAPDELLDQMIEHASGGQNETPVLLDSATMHHALTADVKQHYSTNWDAQATTHFEDVGIFRPTLIRNEGMGLSQKASRSLMADLDDVEASASNRDQSSTTAEAVEQPCQRMFTAASIDSVADTVRSQTFTVTVWACFVVTYFAYFTDVDSNFGRIDCGDSFGCSVANGIVNWLVIFLQLSVLGSAYIVLGSAGNSLKRTKRLEIVSLLIGIAAMVGLTVIPFVYEVRTPFFDTEKDEGALKLAYYLSVALGCLLIFMQLLQLFGEIFDMPRLKGKWRILGVFFTAGIRKMERHNKQAATFKVARMVQNALENYTHTLYSSSAAARTSRTNHQSIALVNFQMRELQTERVGGLFWGWKRLWNKSIFVEEGVWLHNRLMTCVAAQLVVCLIQIFAFTSTLLYIEDLVKSVEDSTPEDQEALVNRWEVSVSFSFGIIAGILGTFAISVIYIPSFISTVLQFRSGVIPSLRSRGFLVHRVAVDQTSLLVGSTFWGALFTALMLFLIVGGLVFLIVWHETRNVALTLIGQIIGVLHTVILKMIILILLRASFYSGFYRKKPAPANYMNVVLECWNLGLSAGYMLVRSCKLVLAAAMYLGRLDTPFLAPGAGMIGPINLDAYPVAFRKDLLVHEAHRHPYLERLGVMYMLQLKYRQDFATRAGSCWRLLFVLALMPWMRRYRVRFVGDALEREMTKIDEMLKEDEDKDDDEENNKKEALDRRKALQNRRASLQILQKNDKLSGNREEQLEREVKMLQSQLEDLRKEMDAMKGCERNAE